MVEELDDPTHLAMLCDPIPRKEVRTALSPHMRLGNPCDEDASNTWSYYRDASSR